MQNLFLNLLHRHLSVLLLSAFEEIVDELLLVDVHNVLELLVVLEEIVWLSNVLVNHCTELLRGFSDPRKFVVNLKVGLSLELEERHQIRLKVVDAIGGLDDHVHAAENVGPALLDAWLVDDPVPVILIFLLLLFLFSLLALLFVLLILLFLLLLLLNRKVDDHQGLVRDAPELIVGFLRISELLDEIDKLVD